MSRVGEPRRIAAVVLPELLCELAAQKLGVARAVRANSAEESPDGGARKRRRSAPSASRKSEFAVVFSEASRQDASEPIKATTLLEAVSHEARRYGVREGQSIAEACALVSHLEVVELEADSLRVALTRVAEAALAFGATVAFEAPDTVWVDVTGASHLFGGEAALATELASRVRALGHLARVAVGSGPRVAQAMGRFGAVGASVARGERGVVVVPPGKEREAMSELPVAALPVEREAVAWLVRLGVLTLGELARIPRATAASRLGAEAREALDLCEGRDDAPLTAYEPTAVLVEESSWDEPADGIEPLLFVLRGLAARLSARLAGRGEAAQKLLLEIEHDRASARHLGAPKKKELIFDLSTPLWREEELGRVVSSRLERTRLEAPSVGLRLAAPAVIRALGRQLDLARVSGGVTANKGIESLPVLLAELAADIGKERLGVLALVDSHRMEKKSELKPALEELRAKPKKTKRDRAVRPLSKVRPVDAGAMGAPTRLLSQPVPLDVALRVGATLRIEHRLYSIERIGFVERLELVEWWTGGPIARDYLWLWLRSKEGVLEAMVYVDRATGRRFLSAVGD